VSVTEPSDAVNAGMAIQTEGSLLALRASGRPQLDLWLVGWFTGVHCDHRSSSDCDTDQLRGLFTHKNAHVENRSSPGRRRGQVTVYL